MPLGMMFEPGGGNDVLGRGSESVHVFLKFVLNVYN